MLHLKSSKGAVLSQQKAYPKYSLLAKDTRKDFKKNWSLYVMVLPVLAFYILFCYVPMYGVVIAFKDFNMTANYSFWGNIVNSDWVGFKYFVKFFQSPSFSRILSNTLRISFTSFIIEFPMPLILALLVNELRMKRYKRLIQTTSYLPHFISLVVVCGMVKSFTGDTGIISVLSARLTGGEATTMLADPAKFLPIYIISDIWKGVGWGSIIYLAALSGVDPQLYEAAVIDGAKRFQQVIYITLPSIVPTIVVLLILRIGGILNVGYEKILLLQNPLNQSVSEVISTYTYRRGLIDRDWSFSAMVGIFNSVVNIIFLVSANYFSKKIIDTSLW